MTRPFSDVVLSREFTDEVREALGIRPLVTVCISGRRGGKTFAATATLDAEAFLVEKLKAAMDSAFKPNADGFI